jgi:hypothetical protein
MLNVPNGSNSIPGSTANWWERPWFVALVLALSTAPLLYPPIPPLVDLLGHMGRYRVELDLARSPSLQLYYGYRWAAIGNLGVDVLVKLLGPLLGLEPAVKLIVLTIPAATVAGCLWVAREVHGRIPPTALFALPFAYGHPFLFGFVNYTLAMALAFLGFALWLRLGRLGRTRLRAMLFVPISVVIFFCHTYGWGVLGLLCFSAEAVRQHDSGRKWLKAGLHAAFHAVVMALPIIIMLAWRSETHGGSTFGWFEWRKWEWIYSALRDRWLVFDVASVILAALVLLFAVISRALTFSRNLAFSAIVLTAAFAIIPWTVFGSSYADMRIVPYVLMTALLAVRFQNDASVKVTRAFAVLGTGFYAVRLGATAASLAIASNGLQARLAALEHLPIGSRVVSLVGLACPKPWALPRTSHIGGMVITRRLGFSNDQWLMEGINLLQLRYTQAGIFRADSSQIVRMEGCRGWTVSMALAALPRDRFDYAWLVDTGPYDPQLVEGMQPVWRGPGSILYRLNP